MAKRDTMRERIYRAEDQLVKNGLVPIQGREELNDFSDNIMKRAWWKRQVDGEKFMTIIYETTRAGYTNGCIYDCVANNIIIDVDSQTSSRLHVLHSLSHVIRDSTVEEKLVPHDIDFVIIYLEMVRRYYNNVIDNEFKKVFKQAIMSQGVKTKKVTEETRKKQQDAYVERNIPTEDALVNLIRGIENIS